MKKPADFSPSAPYLIAETALADDTHVGILICYFCVRETRSNRWRRSEENFVSYQMSTANGDALLHKANILMFINIQLAIDICVKGQQLMFTFDD